MTKSTPLTLIGLLGGGALIFTLNAFFPVPLEGWFAVVGMLVFVAGMLFGLVGVIRAIAVLINYELRAATGVIVPSLTILIACGAWIVVVYSAIQVKKSLDQRATSKQGYSQKVDGSSDATSQRSAAGTTR